MLCVRKAQSFLAARQLQIFLGLNYNFFEAVILFLPLDFPAYLNIKIMKNM